MKKFLILFLALLLTAQLFAQLYPHPASNIECIASCYTIDDMALFDVINRNPYTVVISYSSGESFVGDLILEPNADNQIMIYASSIISFTYNGFLFRSMATNNDHCGTPQAPYTKVFAYSIGSLGGINVVLVENKNSIPIYLRGKSGEHSKSFEVPANGQVYVIGDNTNFIFYFNEFPFVWLAPLNGAIKEASFIAVSPVCMDATTATFEIQNNDTLSHDAILRNSSGTEHRYSLAASGSQTVTVENCNWDIYLAVPEWVDICNQLVDSSMMVGSVAPANAHLTVSEKTVNADADPYTQNIMVSSDKTWTVSSDQPWLTLNKASGAGNEEFILSASANTSGISRTATITITAGCEVETVIVSQWIDVFNALNFDGVNDNVAIADNDATISTAFTIAGWVLWQPNAATDIQFICGKGVEQMEIHTGAGANGLRFIPTTGVWLDAANVLPVNQWTHVACTYNATDAKAKMFINGKEVVLVNHGANPIGTALQSTASSFFLGSRSSATYFLKGSLDEFSLWNRVLTQSEIQQNRLISFDPALQTGLISFYTFDIGTAEGTNTGFNRLNDRTRNFNGTLNNFALTGATSNWVESYAMVVPVANPASSVTSSGFTANWTAPVVGTVENYLLEVATDSSFVNLVSAYDPLSTTDTFAVVSGLSPESTYYYRARADKASVTGQGSWSNTIKAVTAHFVPIDHAVADTTIASGEACFNAINELTVSTVSVEATASANFIAGYSVTFLPGFRAFSGSYVHAQITETASFCDVPGGSPIVSQPEAKGLVLDETEKGKVIDNEIQVKVYPNPNNGQFKIEISGTTEEHSEIQVFNLLGKVVFSGSMVHQATSEISIYNATKGLYLMKVTTGKESISKKILIH